MYFLTIEILGSIEFHGSVKRRSPLKWTFSGNASRRIQHFYREYPRMARHFHRIARRVAKRMKRADKGSRGGFRSGILSLAEGPVTEIRDFVAVLYISLRLPHLQPTLFFLFTLFSLVSFTSSAISELYFPISTSF